MFRNIAVGTDFSPGAQLAVDRAAQLAVDSAATLTLLHVVPAAPIDSLGDDLLRALGAGGSIEALSAEAYERLARAAAGVQQQRGVACEVRIASGRPAACLAAIAAEGADLLVVGAHGAHTRRSARLGTTAQKLLRLEPCPVLTVRHATHGRYRRILAPVDFSPASRAALRAVSDAFPDTELHVAHAFEHPMESMMRYAAVDESVIKGYTGRRRALLARELRRWAHAAAPARPAFDFHVGHGYPTAVIERLLRKLHVDLVALAPRGKSALEKSFLGSVALHVALNSPCDVLLLAGARIAGDPTAAANDEQAGRPAAPVAP